jgi:hypothetical protein
MHDALPEANPEITAEKAPDFSIDTDTADWLRNLKSKCEKLNESDWLNIKRQMLRARNYFDGRQYGDVTPQLQWQDYPKQVGEISYTAPTYQAHVQTAQTEMSKGTTQLSFSHVSGESRRGTLIAKIADLRFKAHKRKTFNSTKKTQENLNLLLSGVAIRYTFTKDCDYKHKTPKLGDKVTAGESVSTCSECYAPMSGPKCEICGNDSIAEIKTPDFSMKTIVGYDEVAAKESDWIAADPIGFIWYLHATTVRETPFVIWKQAFLTETIQAKYKDVKIKEGVKSPELTYKAYGEAATPAERAMGTDEATGKCELHFCWFDPPMYANYVPKQDLKLRRGVVAPANVPLGKTWPNGVLIVFNDKTILDIEGEDKNTKLTIAPYVTRIGSMIGAGTSSALDDQDTKNDLRNLHMQSIYNDAFRKEFVDPQFIDPDQIPANPTERAVLRSSPPGGKIVGSAVDALPPSPLSSDAYAMEERIDGEMQMLMGTFSGTQNGMPDLKAVQDTAAGMQMWREMTIGRFYPMLETRADCLDREQAYQFLENDQKYLSPEQWNKVKGEYDEEAVQEFLNCDLREELIVEVVPESFMPVSTSQKQAGLMGWSKFIMETQAPPDSEISAHAADLFNVPKKLVANDAFESMAHVFIDACKEQSDAVISDPELGDLDNYELEDPTTRMLAELILNQANMPISFKMDNLSVLADTLKDWWATDEGRNSSNLLKATILLRMEEIDGAAIAKSHDDFNKTMQAQAPAMEMQAQAANAQMEQQNAANQAQVDAQGQQEQAKMDAEAQKRQEETEAKAVEKVVDLEQAEAERTFQANEAQKARDHEEKMAKMKPEQKKK